MVDFEIKDKEGQVVLLLEDGTEITVYCDIFDEYHVIVRREIYPNGGNTT